MPWSRCAASRKIYPGGVQALDNISVDFPRGRAHLAARPLGLRQDHAPEDHRRAAAGDLRRVLVNGRPVSGPGPGARLRLPGFRADALGDGDAQRRLRAGAARRRARRSARRRAALYRRRSASAASSSNIRTSFPAACASASAWRARSSVNADVLLMDEPFSAVDEQTRRKFQEDLLALVAQERKTFIFVTHSIEEAVYVSDRIVLLSPRPGPRLADHRAGHLARGRSRRHPPPPGLSRYGRRHLAGPEAVSGLRQTRHD